MFSQFQGDELLTVKRDKTVHKNNLQGMLKLTKREKDSSFKMSKYK